MTDITEYLFARFPMAKKVLVAFAKCRLPRVQYVLVIAIFRQFKDLLPLHPVSIMSIKNSAELAQPWQAWSILLLFVIIAFGTFIRTESFFTWPEKQDILFSGQEPVLIGLDGYYYLNIAKEIGDNTYSSVETRRAYPEGVNRSPHPSLLPVLLNQLSKLSGLSLNWIAIWLPVFLGMTVVLPVFLIARLFLSPHGVVAAVAVATLAPYFITKTQLSHLDTDSLNLVLPLLCTYFFMRFGLDTSPRRYLHFLAGILVYLIFLWWWDISPQAATAIALAPLGIALLFHYRPAAKEGLLFFFLILICLLTLFFFADLSSRLITLVKGSLSTLSYISKQDFGIFPNVGESIQEQQRASFLHAMVMNIANLGCLVLALIGIGLFIVREKTRVLYLLPMAIVGMFSFFYAVRFTFFLTPLLAIGFGAFFSIVFLKIGRKYLYYTCYGLAIGSLFWGGLGMVRHPSPIFRGEIVTGMVSIKENTPENALIWSWWDEGHPLMYWSERATINDGMVHGGARDYYTALPMASDDFRFAANFMQFYAVRGGSGIESFIRATGNNFAEGMAHLKTILSLGPVAAKEYLDELSPVAPAPNDQHYRNIDYYYPTSAPPIYLFLNSRMLRTMPWIYWYGTWDTKRKTGSPMLPTLHMWGIYYNDHNLPQHPGVILNSRSGSITVENRLPEKSPLHSIVIPGIYADPFRTYNNFSSDLGHQYHFPKEIQAAISAQIRHTDTGMYTALLFPEKNELILEDNKIAYSVLYHLFIHKIGDQKQFFTSIDTTEEHYQIWQVNGEKP